MARRLEQRDRLAELADLGAHVIAEHQADLDVASLVPALSGHVELHRQRSLGGRVVERRAARTLERLDLADEDAVHLATGPIARLARRRIQPAILTEVVGPFVGEALLGRDAIEASVAGKGARGQLRAHAQDAR